MEYIIMIVSHIFKTAEYFITEGLPNVPLEQLPYLADALMYNLIKIFEIYLSGFT